ncbi:MAG: FixH family protein [Desulfobulbaceae bacterium]|nr:FixH family protein [Desulfobulbaceae bacterium]
MLKRILTIVLCCSVIALFPPVIGSSPVSAADTKCQCQKEAPCQCDANCQCEHCKTGKMQCEHCKNGLRHCQGKAEEKGCSCEHCKTEKGQCSCRSESKKCQCKTDNATPETSAQPTTAKLFKVSYKTAPAPIPINAFHAWTLTVQNADGQPVTDAEITVNGSMPAHGHDLQSVPTVKNLGNGDYLVEGVKFFMPGRWVMNFSIKTTNKEDKVTFSVDI